jgi:hypothetical protein
MQLPVKGDRCQIFFTNDLASGTQVFSEVVVMGTARELPERMDWLRTITNDKSILGYLNPAAYGSAVEQPRYVMYGDWARVNPIFINGTGRILHIGLHVTNNVTTAGLFVIRDAITLTQIARFDVPLVTGSQVISYSMPLPISTPIGIVGTSWVTTGVNNLHLYWED